MTSHERFEPDRNRPDETARRLHMVHEDHQAWLTSQLITTSNPHITRV